MQYNGMTGKILKIDLSAPSAEIVETSTYAELSGGAALASRILLQELPTDLKDAYDEKNILVFAAGALTGSGYPGSCGLTVAALSPISGTPCCHQMNGRLGTMLRYAGYDAIIIGGVSASPVWVNINNNEVKMESAAFLWGAGTHDTTAQICSTVGKEAAVAAIGPAGENKLDIASIVALGSAAADGLGGVMGSKNLKAIALRGTGAVTIAAPEAYQSQRKGIDQVICAPGGSVVPSQQQSWSEYHADNSWWNAAPGLCWGESATKVETGECAASDTSRMGLRTLSVVRDFGEEAADHVVRAVACPGCTTGCAAMLRLPALERAGLPPYQLCGCEALRNARGFMPKAGELPEPEAEKEEEKAEETEETLVDTFAYSDLEIAAAAAGLAEDFGVGLLGGQLAKNFRFAVDSGALEKALSAKEYGSFDWEQYRSGDLAFLVDVFRRLGKNSEAFAKLGTANVAEEWKFAEEDYAKMEQAPICGVKRVLDADDLHGAAEAALAAVAEEELRRPMNQLLDCGLPADIVEKVIAAHSGANVITDVYGKILIPEANAELLAWSAKQAHICSLLGLCGRLWPLSASASKEDGYVAHPLLTANMAAVVCGGGVDQTTLEQEALAGLAAARVLRCAHAKTTDPAAKLDGVNQWVTAHNGITEDAVAAALQGLYNSLGWDKTTGVPTAAALKGLHNAAELLAGIAKE